MFDLVSCHFYNSTTGENSSPSPGEVITNLSANSAECLSAKGAGYESGPSAKGAEYNSQGQVPTLSGRRPWIDIKKCDAALKGRNTVAYISAFQASALLLLFNPGATRFALAPGFCISRLRRYIEQHPAILSN